MVDEGDLDDVLKLVGILAAREGKRVEECGIAKQLIETKVSRAKLLVE